MSQISLEEATDLLEKLLSERILLQAVLAGPLGTYANLFGFVDSITNEAGLIVSESGPPIDTSRGYLRFLFQVGCSCWYGEKRELPDDIKSAIPESRGDSVLYFLRPASGERLTLFFTF